MSQLSNSVSNFIVCDSCNHQNPHLGKFCIKCGNQLKSKSSKPNKLQQKRVRQSENKILVLASNPASTERLQLNPEIRSIKKSHERSSKRDEFTTRLGKIQ